MTEARSRTPTSAVPTVIPYVFPATTGLVNSTRITIYMAVSELFSASDLQALSYKMELIILPSGYREDYL